MAYDLEIGSQYTNVAATAAAPIIGRVYKIGGNQSGLTGYRSGPVSVWAGIKPVQIQNSNLNSKNEKFPKNS